MVKLRIWTIPTLEGPDGKGMGINMKKDKEIRIGTLLGSGTELEGDFSADGSARIDGIIRGNVTVTGSLIIGATGSIEGNVSAKAVLIGGEIVGNVEAPEKAELTAGAKVLGDIVTSVIVIDEHAVFQGKCDMNQTVPDRRVKSKAVRAGKKSAKPAIVEALKEVEAANKEAEQTASEMENSELL